MQADGDLVVYQGERPIWSSGTGHGGSSRYYLSLQDNGTAVIYSAARKAVWATNTAVLGLQLGDTGPAVRRSGAPVVAWLLGGSARSDLWRLDPAGRLGAPEGRWPQR